MLLFKLNYGLGQTQIMNILLLSALVNRNGLQIPCFFAFGHNFSTVTAKFARS